MMIESLFAYERTRSRQRDAPLLHEREQYLASLSEQGVCKEQLRSIAAMLLNVVRFLELTELRVVDSEELRLGRERWLAAPRVSPAQKNKEPIANRFILIATRWLQYHKRFRKPLSASRPIADSLGAFVHFLTATCEYAPDTIRTHRTRVAHFLEWAMVRHESLELISINDIDDFLAAKWSAGYRPRSIGSFCSALRLFFRFAEAQGWNQSRLFLSIRGPNIPRTNSAPGGPRWADVRRLLRMPAAKPPDLRAAAIMFLCSIYGLRSSEVVNLKLRDFNWVGETFVVNRAKRGRVQQFPIQYEVGEAILRYLRFGRPECSSRYLFVSLKPPFRQMRTSTLWGIVADRMKILGVKSKNLGAHALRHACATQLLHKGSSLQDIADLLGHRDLKSVCIYAKYDRRSLKEVANFSLRGVR